MKFNWNKFHSKAFPIKHFMVNKMFMPKVTSITLADRMSTNDVM